MTIKIAGAQLNTTIGDLLGNVKKMQLAAKEAQEKYAADLIIFPELVISGYPPEDLLFRNDFLLACEQAVLDYAATTPNICSIIGTPWLDHGVLKNAAIVTQNGKLQNIYFKQTLPNYGVFDEKRYFTCGMMPCVISIKNTSIGIAVCEDLWVPETAMQLKKAGAEIIVSLNASPFEIGKQEKRVMVLRERIHETKLPIFYVNHVGGQDDLLFDGGSILLNASGDIIMQSPCFTEDTSVFEFNTQSQTLNTIKNTPAASLNPIEEIYQALKLGLHDYVRKTGFKRVLVGSSGGIDSAVTLAIAVDALGAENVTSVMMPSKYTAQMSLEDAKQLAKNLIISHHVISIENCFTSFLTTLEPLFDDLPFDKTEENLQARTRGTLLMALSNKWNNLVLITGNRSEMAVGYATLYGDMAGGFAVLKDVYKTQVYGLANYINRQQEIIPQNIITRPPTAELRENQKDEDSLPPYHILDQILSMYLDEEKSLAEIMATGFEARLVQDIIHSLHLNEYKRQQAPIGSRIHHQAFGRRARRYPITQGYKG